MSRTIHINLLRDDERVSSNPVRLRVMAPILCGIALAALLGWWQMVAAANAARRREADAIGAAADGLKPAVAACDALALRIAAARAEIDQIACYRNGRVVFGDMLAKLPDVVPASVQFTSVTIPPPYRPPAKKEDKPPVRSATKTGASATAVKPAGSAPEKVFINFAGLVDSAETAARLKAAMAGPAFAGLVKSAEIPGGAFKMSSDGSGQFLFEISCECTERSFK